MTTTALQSQSQSQTKLRDLYPSLCMNCIISAHNAGQPINMLTGYCLTGCACDGCGRITDLAICGRQGKTNETVTVS